MLNFFAARQLQAEAQQQLQLQAAARQIKKEEPEEDGDNEVTRIVEITKAGVSLGLTICKTSNSRVFIAHILSNGPAAQQGGLRTGDEILKVSMDLGWRETTLSLLLECDHSI